MTRLIFSIALIVASFGIASAQGLSPQTRANVAAAIQVTEMNRDIDCKDRINETQCRADYDSVLARMRKVDAKFQKLQRSIGARDFYRQVAEFDSFYQTLEDDVSSLFKKYRTGT